MLPSRIIKSSWSTCLPVSLLQHPDLYLQLNLICLQDFMGFPLVHNLFAVSYRLFIAMTFDKKNLIVRYFSPCIHLWSTLSESVGWMDASALLQGRFLYFREITFFGMCAPLSSSSILRKQNISNFSCCCLLSNNRRSGKDE